MKSFMKEFKEFISRGNVMDMAVGIIIGGAFTAIVTSLVEDIITPIIGMIGGFDFSSFVVTVNNSNIAIGKFVNAVINFLLIAFVLFSVIKALNKAASIVKKPEEEAAPTTKMCPYCKSEIAIEATRCPHCTSQLDA
ncbi:MAG: large conductance mechanosensitive channel protein MscL [Lachnospiraceae bacterium]|jgi:large conductance mechanosensitive channel|nr:large conductance mechanosensitive channel protein MscL [Lachnospiraceae bacterium]